MKRLVVYLNSEAVGTLEEDDNDIAEFRYRPDWIRNPAARPLSRMLPLQDEAFRGKHARAFFAGILPEEGPRRQIAAILGISDANDVAMLERIGGECAGAVCLLPEDAAPPAIGETRLRQLSEKELQDVVAELPRRPLMAGEEGIRLSLAGAQDKLPVVVRESGIALPLGNTASTHIVKPEPDRLPGLATNELLCMTLARTVGLRVPAVHSRRVGDKACILVERYDRLVGADSVVTRVHQEDFCQALGFPPERKYQAEGGPLLRDCIGLLREWSTTPVLDIRDFVDGLIFNMLIGNADAHGKNFSMLYRGDERRLAPFYDLVCTLAWPELSKAPAMKIGGAESINEITPTHWRKMAQETRLGWPMMRERMAALSRNAVDALQDPRVRNVAEDAAMAERLIKIISERGAALLRSLETNKGQP